jgi:hypothetical protein
LEPQPLLGSLACSESTQRRERLVALALQRRQSGLKLILTQLGDRVAL